MRIVVIGATGHIGSFLVPRLVDAGHEVVGVTRGRRRPYPAGGTWPDIETVVADRDAEDAAGTFGTRIADLRADVVVDLVCFTLDSARQLTTALDGRTGHLLHCGSIWAYGASGRLPSTEDSPRRPHTTYGKAKAAIERHLLETTAGGGVPATVVHPGHISGPGWVPVNPAGNLDLSVFEALATGGRVALPDRGLSRLQHVHADDVAGVFLAAIAQPERAVGEAFDAVAEHPQTMLAYAVAAAAWWGREAAVDLVPLSAWWAEVDEEHADVTLDHLSHSPNHTMAKAADLLEFRPAFTAEGAARDAVEALVAEGRLPPLP